VLHTYIYTDGKRRGPAFAFSLDGVSTIMLVLLMIFFFSPFPRAIAVSISPVEGNVMGPVRIYIGQWIIS